MEIIISCEFGSKARLNKKAAAKYTNNCREGFDRRNPELIAALKKDEDICSKRSNFRVATIPDETTSYMIRNDRGYETIIYVVDGKLHVL